MRNFNMESFTGKQLIGWDVETDMYGYPINPDETYVVDHHRDNDGRGEFVTLIAWQNSHHDLDNYPYGNESESERSFFFDFPKTEKIEIRLRQDLADRLPVDKGEKNVFINRAVSHEFNNLDMFRRLGSAKTPLKAATARENGKKGGRPKKTDLKNQ